MPGMVTAAGKLGSYFEINIFYLTFENVAGTIASWEGSGRTTLTLKCKFMEKVKLDFGVTLKDSITIGLKNAPSILGCVALWLVTIWIPWINIGTTIAIMTLPIELSKGKVISPLSIFDAKYRKYFGEVFMTLGLMFAPMLLAYLFMIIPGIVLGISWMLAIYLVLDKGTNPAKAISASNEATYGSKWAIFGVQIVIGVAYAIVAAIFSAIFNAIGVQILTMIVTLCIYIVTYAIMIAANASIYRQLGPNVQ